MKIDVKNILRSGKPGTYNISFSSGSDYLGSFGDKSLSGEWDYRSIEKVLKIAEDAGFLE